MKVESKILKILIIDASGVYCSIGLYDSTKKDFIKSFISKKFKKRNHAEVLIYMVKDIFFNLRKKDINLIKYIAVSKGPGSFTGIRASIAVAEGLSFSLNIPIIGINVFEKLFWIIHKNINSKIGVLTISNTRRGYYYVKIHSILNLESFDKNIKILSENNIRQIKDLDNFDKIIVIGDESKEISKELNKCGLNTTSPIKTKDTYGKTGLNAMAQIALKAKKSNFKNQIKPLYLSEPITN